jgi:hypothetical protein
MMKYLKQYFRNIFFMVYEILLDNYGKNIELEYGWTVGMEL